MKKATVSGITATLALMCSTAYAERSIVIVLDATGSMMQVRDDGTCAPSCPTRYQAAQKAAVDDLLLANGSTEGVEKVAVFMFSDDQTAIRLTGTAADPFITTITGALDPTSAEYIITHAVAPFGSTPLAGAMCAAVTTARNSTPGSIFGPPHRWLKVYTDGEENFTPMSDPCFGPPSVVLKTPPFDDGSWHQKVYQLTTNPLPAVLVDTTLYVNLGNPFAFSFSTPPAPVEVVPAAAPAKPTSFSLFDTPVTDLEFFTILSTDSGGTFTAVADSAPAPVIGDLDFDFDVDRADAIVLARAFGTHATTAYDLDQNGSIGFGDYTRLLSRFGNGSGTPVADPYTQRNVVTTCGNSHQLVIENQVIEANGLTIESTSSCTITIRNSLIVSGSTAITTKGAATLILDNSYIVGEGKWLDSRGAITLSAANTVFHGARASKGAFVYHDRGGNTFE